MSALPQTRPYPPQDDREPPPRLAAYRGRHAGETLLVCGCGASLSTLAHPERFVTIGVNDVGRLFQPDYLVVVNPRNQFQGDRFRYVDESRSRAVFTQLELGLRHPHVVRFQLGKRGGVDFSNPSVLHYTTNSPYVALCLAVHMGARRIGLIGVDFTDHHFFAHTGTHPLQAQLVAIDAEYRRLYDACRRMGIEVFNLSASSRLSAIPKRSLADLEATAVQAPNPSAPRVFGVDYRFLACGNVFGTGMRDAAEELGLSYESALWDDARLPVRIERFQPDLILVVHGRRFVQKWGQRFSHHRLAVWLLDEPYEVDDTSRWSGMFQTVFVNDPATISRHRNAHYLPACFNPRMHRDLNLARVHQVGFVGGYNQARERYLCALAESGRLSYVVGGPWRSNTLGRLSQGENVSPERTAALYRETRVVLNVFREVHHFNREGLPARSMNPRIYEALACGALVLSEARPEIREVFPDLPVFDTPSSMLSQLERLLSDEPYRLKAWNACRARLRGHSYTDRLAEVLRICAGIDREAIRSLSKKEDAQMDSIPAVTRPAEDLPGASQDVREKAPEPWLCYGDAARLTGEGQAALFKSHSADPGSETGLVSAEAYNDVELSFDLWLGADTWFIAKLHQLDQFDQKTNSYHIVAEPAVSYLAKHNTILSRLAFRRGVWQKVTFRSVDQLQEIVVDGVTAARVLDNQLQSGYCFLGVKGGSARLRNIRVQHIAAAPPVHNDAATPVMRAPKAGAGRNGNDHESALWPFNAMPRRNIIYHIWPVRGSMWRWNLDQLKNRLDLFNGHRIIGIVQDERTEPPERVQEYLEGHGCEFLVGENDIRGEAISFPLMMQKVASDDPDELTFYGHAKGVKYEPNVPAPVRRWSEVQYRVALDDWMTVAQQLQRFAMTGPFRMLGRFRAHRYLADWHYSGTYFWMRHAHIFSRAYLEVPQFYGGVETWPGIMFSKEETGCLFMDNLRQLPYHEEFWRRAAEPAFQHWEAGVRGSPAPPDLVQPLPYKGCATPGMEQKPDEFAWWVDRLLRAEITTVLTIGSKEGGVEWHLAREFFNQGRKIDITAVDIDPHPQLLQTFSDAERCFGQSLKLVVGDSTSLSITEHLSRRYDAVFIDGDHTYRACRHDFDLAKSLGSRIIGLHDIVDSDWHAQARCCVSRLWRELKEAHRTEEKSSGEWGGIGIVELDR